ncbi:AAA family ATPase [Sphaerospermopsis sp. LEGE 08334]|uniref:AAA family ATPase n=1 Tax=Sphaerospermopsis sp. LEGE 08334 TaxID=1828651 RepID=UPI00187E98FE|nr:AAA family ATPase [Sphaerospermopsis sp. LEGE 08334]MBE9055783.1 AAA family ATPase [Sphaerospermopsis sp. LEGE 08334]
MLKRIYIDNFRCLVNFELNFDSINLFLGGNGSGKSTIFEALRKLQSFILGDAKLEAIFDYFDFTRWQTLPIQRYELEIDGNGGKYKYELAIEAKENKISIFSEKLWFNGYPLLKYENSEVTLLKDDYSQSAKYPFLSYQSILSSLVPRSDNTKLTWFTERIEKIIIVQIVPILIKSGGVETKDLGSKAENFVAWYKYISQDQGKVAELINVLKEVLDGFRSFKFESLGEQYVGLKLKFASDTDSKNTIDYHLGELSDGQKVLIILYTLIYFMKSEENTIDYTICIDEPENFLALLEIQPWLRQLYDFCDEGKLQSLLISHHPECINYLLASPIGYWFERQSNAPVRVRKISNEEADDAGLKISELIARGWLS